MKQICETGFFFVVNQKVAGIEQKSCLIADCAQYIFENIWLICLIKRAASADILMHKSCVILALIGAF